MTPPNPQAHLSNPSAYPPPANVGLSPVDTVTPAPELGSGEVLHEELHTAPQSSISGATTPTQDGEMPLLRFRKQDAVQKGDSRIMALIGRRSVLSHESLYVNAQQR